jgi:hypothetical protein
LTIQAVIPCRFSNKDKLLTYLWIIRPKKFTWVIEIQISRFMAILNLTLQLLFKMKILLNRHQNCIFIKKGVDDLKQVVQLASKIKITKIQPLQIKTKWALFKIKIPIASQMTKIHI